MTFYSHLHLVMMKLRYLKPQLFLVARWYPFAMVLAQGSVKSTVTGLQSVSSPMNLQVNPTLHRTIHPEQP